MDKILIVDDEESILTQLKWALSKEYKVLPAADSKTALELLANEKPNLAMVDISLSPSHPEEEEGMKLLGKILELQPETKVVMVTGHQDRKTALKAINMGAHDYYQKPIDIEELKVIIKRTLKIQKLERENEILSRELEGERSFENMIGNCPPMMEVFNTIKKVATTDATVLITGESGTGKELAARAIHFQSNRKEGPFVVVNCGAIPENLLESELFGHEKGSFTGAHKTHRGKFEVANGGTIFLDEVGELSSNLQVKLLRCLQEREIERVGGNNPIELDLRIIAASNKNLEEEMFKNNFRKDLYYRLGVVSIALPPLRERSEDTPLFVQFLLNKFARENRKKTRGVTAEAMTAIRRYHWPGNIRELENRIKKAVIMTDKPVISSTDLGLEPIVQEQEPISASLKDARKQLEKKWSVTH